MKRILLSIPAILMLMVSFSAFSQKYKTAADTVNLNKEYLKVSKDVIEQPLKITIAQNNLPGYQSRASSATASAQNTTLASSDQASKATNLDSKEAKRAAKRAKQALKQTRNAESANDKVQSETKRISKMQEQLTKKQARLAELSTMRSTLIGSVPAALPDRVMTTDSTK